jgi:aspartate/methionine/tyrosine aminotransferase
MTPDIAASRHPAPIRDLVARIPTSKIGDVAALGRDNPDVIPLWFGEGDLTTPEFISEAAMKALKEGQTFYTWQRGIPELRQAIADYTTRLYGNACKADRISVTSSGMQAILLSCQAIIDPGDNAVVVSPVWPNIVSAVEVMGGEVRQVPLQFKNEKWTLDLDQLFAACDERTKMLFVNSPSNPTGWMMGSEQQAALLDFCRKRRIWLMADEVYARLVYDGEVAPSFLQHARPDDPLLVMQSFSKPWAMTGWRLGWLTSPNEFGEMLAKVIQFNISGSPTFLQYGALAAIKEGEPFIKYMVDRCRAGREQVIQRLAAHPKVKVARPEAAFYAFFSVEGMSDSLAFASKLVLDGKVGLAPGVAFGEGGEGYLRLCFASAPERLSRAMDRIEGQLDKL